MRRQGNIVSFDEARKTARDGRSYTSAPKKTSAKQKRDSVEDRSSARLRSEASFSSSVSRGSSRMDSGRQSVPRILSGIGTSEGRGASQRRVSSSTRAESRMGSVERAKIKTAQDRSGSAQTTNPKNKRNDTGSYKPSKLSELKRNLSKSKAGKEFTKQFGDTTASAAASGPRAAVYKAEMGRQHKKASKMQDTTSNTGSRFSFAGFDWHNSPKFVASLMVVVCLVASGAFLYPAAQQYYVTLREHHQVEAEYQAVEERNSKIQTQVDELSSTEGIEDRVREEYGWVKEGENSVAVYGLDIDEKEVNYLKDVPSGGVEAPETWYSPILDVVFGVE